MKLKILALSLFAVSTLIAQTNTVLRDQAFGKFTPVADVSNYKFGEHELVVFTNGYVITDEEFRFAFDAPNKVDTTTAAKTKFLDDYILGRQKTFEGMERGYDTTTHFQLEYLTYKQNYITPYLNQGKTRMEAEALPEVKFALRRYYCGMVMFDVMNNDIWSKSNNNTTLREFYNNHLSLYQGQTFEISRTKVVYDYQKQLESEMTAKLQSKFPYRINTELLAKL